MSSSIRTFLFLLLVVSTVSGFAKNRFLLNNFNMKREMIFDRKIRKKCLNGIQSFSWFVSPFPCFNMYADRQRTPSLELIVCSPACKRPVLSTLSEMKCEKNSRIVVLPKAPNKQKYCAHTNFAVLYFRSQRLNKASSGECTVGALVQCAMQWHGLAWHQVERARRRE